MTSPAPFLPLAGLRWPPETTCAPAQRGAPGWKAKFCTSDEPGGQMGGVVMIWGPCFILRCASCLQLGGAPWHCPRRLRALAFCSEFCISGPLLSPALGHGNSSLTKVCMCAREKSSVGGSNFGSGLRVFMVASVSERTRDKPLVALSSQGFPPSLIRLLLGLLNMSYSNVKTPELVLFYNIFTCVC